MNLVRKQQKGVLGIDPGLDGGFVIVSPNGEILERHVMPTIESTKRTKKKQKDGTVKDASSTKRFIDLVELNRIFVTLKVKTDHAFMEQVASRPGMSAPSVFKFGRVYGILEALLTAHQMPYTLVTPQKWTKSIHAGIEGGLEPKKKSLMALNRLFPTVDLRLKETHSKPHEGLMDAFLIAVWGKRYLQSLDLDTE